MVRHSRFFYWGFARLLGILVCYVGCMNWGVRYGGVCLEVYIWLLGRLGRAVFVLLAFWNGGAACRS